MSIIISKRPKDKISAEMLKNLLWYGKDSSGIAYVKDKKIYIKKNLSLDKLTEIVNETQDCPCLLHFAAKPVINEKNYCGPYRLDQNHIMAHVGNVWKEEEVMKKGFSQSINLLIMLKGIWNPAYFGQDYLKFLIEKAIPSSSKIVIMNSEGNIQIFNDATNNDYNGMWVSSYVSPPYVSPVTYKASSDYSVRGYNYPGPDLTPIPTGTICTVCKHLILSKSLGRNDGLLGWVCYKCDPEQESDPRTAPPLGALNNVIPFTPHAPKKIQTSVLSQLQQHAIEFVDIFQMI